MNGGMEDFGTVNRRKEKRTRQDGRMPGPLEGHQK